MLGFALPKGVLRYALMPQIGPRLRALFLGGFGLIPFFLASVYQMVGLLPQGHPYLMQSNVGRFGIRHVVAQAMRNLTWRYKNIDQIILFAVVLAGLVIFMVQFIAMGAVLFMQPSVALPFSWAGFFTLPAGDIREQDLASMMLDMVFGVPHPDGTANGFFESCIGNAATCQDNFGFPLVSINLAALGSLAAVSSQFSPLAVGAHTFFPFPYHVAMHQLFGVYSIGLLIIAVIITSYFVATVVAETAQSGIPFGRRFNKTWAPLRIVVAFGLLVPLSVGLNSSQYIVLYAAKYGSAFASNGWRYFNDTINSRYLDAQQNLISTPNVPNLKELVQFMHVAKSCKYAYEFLDLQKLKSEAVSNGTPVPTSLPSAREVRAYVLAEHVSTVNAMPILGVSQYVQFVNPAFLPLGTTYYTIRFGVRDEVRFPEARSYVSPICGELQMMLNDSRPYSSLVSAGLITAEPGPGTIQEGYFTLVRDIWHDSPLFFITDVPTLGVLDPPQTPVGAKRYVEVVNRAIEGLPENPDPVTGLDPLNPFKVTPAFTRAVADGAYNRMSRVFDEAVLKEEASNRWGAPSASDPASASPLYNKGWAAAGIWYNRIAELNGVVTAAAYASPIIASYPSQMEVVAQIKAKYDKSVSPEDRFVPTVSGIDDITPLIGEQQDAALVKALSLSFNEWNRSANDHPSGNPFLSAVSSILGLDGLYNMRQNTDTHPLALISGVGRALVENSIKSLGYAALTVGIGLAFEDIPDQLVSIPAQFFVTVAMIGLTVGFVLFYVVPFLPFIYFFFAVGGWIKGMFEALVGAPLWALAHIRIDANGLPGNAALNGYFLIFEVFLRPILIVFGLLASISTYSALVNVLNSVFSLVVENAAGYDLQSELVSSRFTLTYMRSLIDEFFYTVIYAIVVYMLGMSSFKLIDTIPNNILRWMGQSVATFGDQREDPAQGLTSRASLGSQQILSRLGGGLGALAKAGTKTGG